MLRDECSGCPNELKCGFLATADCAHCPNAMICPAEQLVRGFYDCGTPTGVFSQVHQSKTCQLKEKFARVPRPVAHDKPPAETKNYDPRCLRCGAMAQQAKAHVPKVATGVDDPFGIFQDVKFEPQFVHVCTRCGNSERVKALLTKEAPIEEVAVFILKKPGGKA